MNTDFLNILTEELYKTLSNGWVWLNTEDIKTTLSIALYKAYNIGKEQGWAFDMDRDERRIREVESVLDELEKKLEG